MACGEHPQMLDYLTNMSGQAAFDFVYCSYTEVVGAMVFTLFVIASFGLMHLAHDDGNPINVIVLTIILGGIFLGAAPPNVVGMLILGTILVVSGVIVYGILSARPT